MDLHDDPEYASELSAMSYARECDELIIQLNTIIMYTMKTKVMKRQIDQPCCKPCVHFVSNIPSIGL